MSLKSHKVAIKLIGIYAQLNENEGPFARFYSNHHTMDISDTDLGVLGVRQYW
jgi:hypothetical protein